MSMDEYPGMDGWFCAANEDQRASCAAESGAQAGIRKHTCVPAPDCCQVLCDFPPGSAGW